MSAQPQPDAPAALPSPSRALPIVAAILTGPATGVGHALLGRFRRGLQFCTGTCALFVSIPFTGIYGIGVLLLLQLAALVDLIRVRPSAAESESRGVAWLRALILLGGLAGVAMVYRTFAFELFHVPSGAMMPTLEVGDRFFINKLPLRAVRRGDVVVFRHPQEPKIDMVERVVAVGGDTLRMREGRLWLRKTGDADFAPVPRTARGELRLCDRDPTEESGEWKAMTGRAHEEQLGDAVYRTLGDTQPPHDGFQGALRASRTLVPAGVEASADTFGPIPPGFLFMLGDNREFSQDSRYWGIVPEGNVKGRAVRVVFSYGGRSEAACAPGIRWSRAQTSLE